MADNLAGHRFPAPARSQAARRRHLSDAPGRLGERACIGRQFAIHEAVLVLARLLHRYDLNADPTYELDIGERLTLMPVGFELSLNRRTPATSSAKSADVHDDVPSDMCPVSLQPDTQI